MDTLNIDCYENIIKFLNIKDRDNLAITCKIFRKYNSELNIYILYKNLHYYEFTLVTALFCYNCFITDFKFLENLTNLKKLYIHNNKNSNISLCPLSKTLTFLNCRNCNITDFKFLEELVNLQELNICNNRNSNISECNLPVTLKDFNCNSCDITNFKFISILNNLKTLDISYNDTIDINNIPTSLKELICYYCNVDKVSVLQCIPTIKILDIKNDKRYIYNCKNNHIYYNKQELKLANFIEKKLNNYTICDNERCTLYSVDCCNIYLTPIYGPKILSKNFIKILDNLLQYPNISKHYPCRQECIETMDNYVVYNRFNHIHYSKYNVNFLFKNHASLDMYWITISRYETEIIQYK